MKGISMIPDNIRAIEEGRKTVTRRLDHLKEINQEPDRWELFVHTPDDEGRIWFSDQPSRGSNTIVVKPRYQVGEVVYIKEAWATENRYNHLKPSEIHHTAKILYVSDGVGEWPTNLSIGKWRSPMFLREDFARYFIKILDVRPERLQEITEEDAQAEGVTRPPCYSLTPRFIEWFKWLWNKINPKYPWKDNPFVWRYEFKKVEGGK